MYKYDDNGQYVQNYCLRAGAEKVAEFTIPSTFSNVMDGLNGISMVLNPVGGMISSFTKNLVTTGGDLSKSFTMAGL